MISEVSSLFGGRSRAEEFLKMYRVLEGVLEKRMEGRRQGASVVMDYLKDEDAEPYRSQLNLCREIRNLLSHNADESGEPVIEPSEAVLASLQEILDYVSAPRCAIECGTPQERILCAHSNDLAIEVMHRMSRQGFSHVPVLEKGKLTGVFSVGSLFSYLERLGLDAVDNSTRIGQLKDALDLDSHGSEKYRFMPRNATIQQVRAAFEERPGRNSRLSAVFITENGSRDEPLLAMLTPWDALKDSAAAE